MKDIFLKPYDPAATESRIYEMWEKSGYFNPDNLPGDRSEIFSIVLPPPNVTGILHMGSALMLVIEDIMVRFARMNGKKTLWIPGTDSAAIATQARVEKDIQKAEKKTRHDLGREELLKRIDTFVDENRSTILSQMRSIGASLDWSRYAYTMDKKRYRAVMEAFVRMYEAGLIYRGNRIVNWDPKGQTTISDDEIVYEERTAKLYTFKYSKDFPISISTTRPETKVGDVAVAVHPDDARYAQYVGKEYDAVFCDVPIHIKIIEDKEVDPEYGTGALGVTPAHSQIDWLIAERHDLPKDKQVINEFAKMMVDGRLNGKRTTEAREAVVDWLREEALLEAEEEMPQNISTAERTGGIIEPLPKLQWWIDVNKSFAIAHSEIPGIESGSKTTLKDIMRTAVESGATDILAEQFQKVYVNWIDNLKDWCISRQIWFGHRIPVWYRGEELYCGTEGPEGEGWEQDPDVLDTWFSSGLWTFSTLGWPETTEDLKAYHPTTIIETGYDILFFWVARMILMSGFLLGQVPFKTVYIHGLVRDGQGRKISKSLGNNIDPAEMGTKYGMDAVRVALIAGMAPGTDSRISEDKIRAYKLFANKLWNITRFILERAEETPVGPYVAADEALLVECKTVQAEVTADMEQYRYHLAIEKLYHYAWDRVASEVLEDSKQVFSGTDENAKKSRIAVLQVILRSTLSMLHPFMPFITEEIWQELGHSQVMLMVSPWPQS